MIHDLFNQLFSFLNKNYNNLLLALFISCVLIIFIWFLIKSLYLDKKQNKARKMFKEKVVVITGSTQGIGKRTAELLAKRGAKIVINSRSPEKVKEVVDSFTLKGYDVLGVAGDVSDYTFCIELKNQIINHFGRIDYLINNAGIAAKGTIIDSNPTAIEQVFKINVFGSLYPSKAMIQEIEESKGGILFISSLAGLIGLPSYSCYSSTKRAIVTLAESLKNEVSNDAIFIGINFPSFTENDAEKKILDGNGELHFLVKRKEVKATKLDNTVNKIIKQLENRKFRSYSFNGKMLELVYRLSPSICMKVLRINREKIMRMD